MNDTEIRQYMSEISKKRKVFKGGFNSSEVQAKIRKIKAEKKRLRELEKNEGNKKPSSKPDK